MGNISPQIYAPLNSGKGALFTSKKVLNNSMGRCHVVVTNDPEKAHLTRGSIFDYKIFGMPPDMFYARTGDKVESNSTYEMRRNIERQMRSCNWGHIELPIPLVMPGSYMSSNKAFLKQILGGEKDYITDVLVSSIVLGEYVLLAPKKGIPYEDAVKQFDIFKKGFSAEEWNKLISSKKIVTAKLNNSHPNVVPIDGELYPNPKHNILLIRKSLLLTSNNKMLTINSLKRYFSIMYCGFAIVELLSYINLKDELAFIYRSLDLLNEKIATSITDKKFLVNGGIMADDVEDTVLNLMQEDEEGKGEVSDDGEVFDGALEALAPIGYKFTPVEYCKSFDSYDSLNSIYTKIHTMKERAEILKGFVKQGIEPYEFAMDCIPVLPAGFRDINKVEVGSSTTYTSDEINKVYNHLIQFSNIMQRQIQVPVRLEDIATYDDLPEENKRDLGVAIDSLPLDRSTLDSIKFAQLKYTWITQTHVDPTGRVKTPADKLIGKPGRFRKYLLGKRYDYTGTGVIVPDPHLKLNYIAMPFKILIAHAKEEVKAIYNLRYKEFLSDSVLDTLDKDNTEHTSFKASYASTRNCGMNRNKDNKASIARRVHGILVELLEDVRYLLIRFPSLWKWNFMGYKIVITYDYAIKLHPLLCSSYNADFDGDRMSAYGLHSKQAVEEVDTILAPSCSPCDMNGEPFHVPAQDAVIGLFHLTREARFSNTVGIYDSYDAMYGDYIRGKLDLRDIVKVYIPAYHESEFISTYLRTTTEDKHIKEFQKADINSIAKTFIPTIHTVDTPKEFSRKAVSSTVGRFILNNYIPQDLGLKDRSTYINGKRVELSSLSADEFNKLPEKEQHKAYVLEWDIQEGIAGFLDKSGVKKIVKAIDYNTTDVDVAIYCKDWLKQLGYYYATKIGITLGLDDIQRFTGKQAIIDRAFEKEKELKLAYKGNPKKLEEKLFNHWTDVTQDVSSKTINSLTEKNWLWIFLATKARGSKSQVTQMLGMRGLMKNPDGSVRLTPVTECFGEGTTPTAFYDSSYGSCASMSDRSQKTKSTGNFTRHLVNTLQALIISLGDCGDNEGYLLKNYYWGKGEKEFNKLKDNLEGRYIAKPVLDKDTGEVLLPKGFIVNHKTEKDIPGVLDIVQEQYGEEGIYVRSPLSCKCPKGKCAKCCGYDYSNMDYFKIGASFGTIVAQGLGQSGTQTVMQNFHTGGVAGEDKNSGFEYVMNALLNAKIIPILKKYNRLLKLTNKANIEYTQNRTANSIKSYLKNHDVTSVQDIATAMNNGIDDLTWEDLGMTASSYYFGMAEEIINSINSAYSSSDIIYKSIHYEMLACAVLNIAYVLDSGDSTYVIGSNVTLGDMIKNNMQAVLHDQLPMVVKPVFSSLKQIPANSNSPLGAICFQQVMRNAMLGALRNSEDDLTNLSTCFITANIMPVGAAFSTVQDKYTVQDDYISFTELLEKADKQHQDFVQRNISDCLKWNEIVSSKSKDENTETHQEETREEVPVPELPSTYNIPAGATYQTEDVETKDLSNQEQEELVEDNNEQTSPIAIDEAPVWA